eukprot:TRINITY_DN1652_c0_g1_i1.p2 TRINITY_DN1652_c0_g1~~TRINITY_DN1652_c0_g1_i1.p2  ORF type:complete len:148 (-),score=53.36 TRINITY_DN1652_c0_g1_i1:153-560(-)
MGKPQARKRKAKAHRPYANGRTRPHTRDLDEIHTVLAKEADTVEKTGRGVARPIDPDLPGLGQHCCVECDRFFLDDEVLREHRRGKVHKRRMKQLAEVPLDLQLQEMLHPVDNGPKLRGPDGKATAAADKDKAMA